jgi:nitrate/nitrite-specific signal transduction histidine kinase
MMNQYLQADLVVAYELIPETGGVPRTRPNCQGNWHLPEQSQSLLETNSHRGAVSRFIGDWQPVYEQDALLWQQTHQTDQLNYAQFIQCEAIQSFVFLPVAGQQAKLAALLFNFRNKRYVNNTERRILQACTALIGSHMMQQTPGMAQAPKKHKAIAHTLYGKVAVMFKGQLDALEIEMRQALTDGLPPQLLDHLQGARNTVFESMRNLVIDASGDLLVDLQTMTLWKALNTAVAALKRAWPPHQQVKIDLHPIPIVIERQSLVLRQLLYTLVLEAVGNAIKHGGPAPYINIDLNWADNQIFVQIIDHGQGFYPQIDQFSEYGLGFWQTYISDELNGTFRVSSQPGFGTVVTATIPVISPRKDDYAE